MATKLQQLLEELKGLKRYYIEIDGDCDFELVEQGRQDLIRDPELVVKDFDLKELITKYTETTIIYKPGDTVRVINNTGYHEFKIGSTATLVCKAITDSPSDWEVLGDWDGNLVQFILTENEEFEPIK